MSDCDTSGRWLATIRSRIFQLTMQGAVKFALDFHTSRDVLNLPEIGEPVLEVE